MDISQQDPDRVDPNKSPTRVNNFMLDVEKP